MGKLVDHKMQANGDSWRWSRWSAPEIPTYTIDVIEPLAARTVPNVRPVPFGFGRALSGPTEREPLLWEGDNA